MVDRNVLRMGGLAAVAGGVLALVGNLLHPRYDGDDVDIYRRIADSDRYRIADLILLVAVLLTAAGFVAVSRSLDSEPAAGLAYYGRLAAVVGATIALAETGLEVYGLKQSAATFASASGPDQPGSFWATNAIDRINLGLFGTWTAVFLGVAPLLIGVAALRARRQPAWIGLLGAVGGLCSLVVGAINLMIEDQTRTDIPFLIGSLLVTAWIICAGVQLLRDNRGVAEPVA
jgi:hypothetical protein